MADLFGNGSSDLDISKVLVALKKGAQLVKYGRKGKPKVYPFRLSNDGSSLIWFSSSGGQSLKLASVSRIIQGQRTAVFQRYFHPEKDYLSFSLIYNNGKRSLDLICKDKVEADVWIAGLKTLISSGHYQYSNINGWNDGGLNLSDDRELISNSPSDNSIATLIYYGDHSLNTTILPEDCALQNLIPLERSSSTNMHIKGDASDVIRSSVSSAITTSSHGSVQDDCDAFGDVYIWGALVCDASFRPGTDRNINLFSSRTDALLPKPLDSNVVLDIHYVACGVRHAALVTRQGEVFTWGEESGGCLGHGVGADIIHPRLVESLTDCHVDFVACGEFHTCAVSISGELYTWGDSLHNAGILGHGTHVSHWTPKRVSGSLEGLQVASVSCGTWHTALITSTGQLFTFGDGTFGVLGHGNRENVSQPKVVESLIGLKIVAVSCGIWHTAAIVEVIVTQSSRSSGKLFTWGDGDEYRLGHGDKEPRLTPTCVPSLIDHDFHKVGCGHSLTIALTTSGHVFTMGSTCFGQLGNPHSDGRLPCLVEDKLAGEFIVDVACGSYHVAVLTTKSEVYTWGKGANGRLGHGDLEDCKMPILVEGLKGRPIKIITCGSNFTAAVCYHKWVSDAEQSQCSACKQAFGFTRKRHNCYNCGLAYCHSCSSRKALRAALSPNLGKPYRVCDSCYLKMSNIESGGLNNKNNRMPHLSGERKNRIDKIDTNLSKVSSATNLVLLKDLDVKTSKLGKKSDSISQIHAPHAPLLIPLEDVGFSGGIDLRRTIYKQLPASIIKSVNHSRDISPFSRSSSVPRSASIPTLSGVSFAVGAADERKKTNALLNQDVRKLRAQVESLRQTCELQEYELQRSTRKAQEAMALAVEESGKSKAAKEVIKSLTAQVRDLAARLPDGFSISDTSKPMYLANGLESVIQRSDLCGEDLLRNDASGDQPLPSATIQSALENVIAGQNYISRGMREENWGGVHVQNRMVGNCNGSEEHLNHIQQIRSGGMSMSSNTAEDFNRNKIESLLNSKTYPNTVNFTSATYQVGSEWVEQYEPGVYITLTALHDGTTDLKRVQFSRRRFGEHQAETWWSENRGRVCENYGVHGLGRAFSSPSSQSACRSEDFLTSSRPLEATI